MSNIIQSIYSAAATVTVTLASLATSATFVAGRSAAEIDNTSNLYVDLLVSGVITVGTTPTINTQIQIWLAAGYVSLATTAVDTLVGTDAAKTITSAGILGSGLIPGPILNVDSTTSDRPYPIPAFSIAKLFGGSVPPFVQLFFAHNTGVNLNATGGNHVVKYIGVKYNNNG